MSSRSHTAGRPQTITVKAPYYTKRVFRHKFLIKNLVTRKCVVSIAMQCSVTLGPSLIIAVVYYFLFYEVTDELYSVINTNLDASTVWKPSQQFTSLTGNQQRTKFGLFPKFYLLTSVISNIVITMMS